MNPFRRPANAAALTALTLALWTHEARAVVLSGEDGNANAEAPHFGLPWFHVGRRAAYSAVYLGNRWVLTAAHVGAFPVHFGNRRYKPQLNSVQRILNRDGTSSDLIAYRIHAAPPLSLLPIARSSPQPGTPVWMLGQGFDRGEQSFWTDSEGIRHPGFATSPTRTMRWGTTRIEAEATEIKKHGVWTRVIATTFSPPSDPGSTRHEAQAAVGDSGGALFVFENNRFALAGVMILRAQDSRQPEAMTLYRNRTLAADLSYYRDQLIALVRPDCSDEIDNDDDGDIDFPRDPGCRTPTDNSEVGGRAGVAR
ncbi:MAG: trypsin-like serine protease [Myxococcota bacterium]|nr:trypsin-like serine protease [Myxococcota bacterium]